MNTGLFALMTGFLLPLALVIRLAVLLAMERGRGWGHPLTLVLGTELLLATVPVITLLPSALITVSGRSIGSAALLLDFTATGWGLCRLAFVVAAVLIADASLPRICDQLTCQPTSKVRPTSSYVLRDLGVLLVCLLLACAAAIER